MRRSIIRQLQIHAYQEEQRRELQYERKHFSFAKEAARNQRNKMDEPAMFRSASCIAQILCTKGWKGSDEILSLLKK